MASVDELLMSVMHSLGLICFTLDFDHEFLVYLSILFDKQSHVFLAA
jgi:hypothetical protein